MYSIPVNTGYRKKESHVIKSQEEKDMLAARNAFRKEKHEAYCKWAGFHKKGWKYYLKRAGRRSRRSYDRDALLDYLKGGVEDDLVIYNERSFYADRWSYD